MRSKHCFAALWICAVSASGLQLSWDPRANAPSIASFGSDPTIDKRTLPYELVSVAATQGKARALHDLRKRAEFDTPVLPDMPTYANLQYQPLSSDTPVDTVCVTLAGADGYHCIDRRTFLELYNRNLIRAKEHSKLVAAVAALSVLLAVMIIVIVGLVLWTNMKRRKLDRQQPKAIPARGATVDGEVLFADRQ